MRRVLTLFLLACAAAVCEAAPATGSARYTDSIMVDVVPTIVAAVSGNAVLDIEAQTTITDAWSMYFGYEAGAAGQLTMFDLEIGTQFRPWAGYLGGAWIGLYPGLGSYSSSTLTDWIVGIRSDVGYELILDPGIVLGVGAGVSWYTGTTARSGFLGNVGFHVGYAFAVSKLHGG